MNRQVEKVAKQNRRGYEGYRRTDTDGRNVVLCSCGLLISARGRTMHTKGAQHKQNKRIRTLLASNCITHTEIASRLKITRERVRQIANKIGVDKGVERRKVCTLQRNLKNLEKCRKLQAFIAKLNTVNIEHKLLPTRKRNNVFFQSRVAVNNHVVDIRTAAEHRHYLQIHSIKTPHDFAAYYLPDKTWLIIPRAKLPKAATMFTLNPDPTGKGAGLNRRHDWGNYLEAWHLLK